MRPLPTLLALNALLIEKRIVAHSSAVQVVTQIQREATRSKNPRRSECTIASFPKANCWLFAREKVAAMQSLAPASAGGSRRGARASLSERA